MSYFNTVSSRYRERKSSAVGVRKQSNEYGHALAFHAYINMLI